MRRSLRLFGVNFELNAPVDVPFTIPSISIMMNMVSAINPEAKNKIQKITLTVGQTARVTRSANSFIALSFSKNPIRPFALARALNYIPNRPSGQFGFLNIQ
jgi:hypothetical protein